MTISTRETPQTILEFWFGSESDDAAVAESQSALWWSKNQDTDDEIRRRYQDLVEAAGRGDLDEWAESPAGRLALILLCDQFPRNIFRGSDRSFAFDAKARELCCDGLATAVDHSLRAIERVFFYMPLEHSESLDQQDESVRLFEALATEIPGSAKTLFDNYVDFAVRHREIVARFGRFPHRNQILGRPSTAEELVFLEGPGSSF